MGVGSIDLSVSKNEPDRIRAPKRGNGRRPGKAERHAQVVAGSPHLRQELRSRIDFRWRDRLGLSHKLCVLGSRRYCCRRRRRCGCSRDLIRSLRCWRGLLGNVGLNVDLGLSLGLFWSDLWSGLNVDCWRLDFGCLHIRWLQFGSLRFRLARSGAFVQATPRA